MSENILECFAEMLMAYIDARLIGDLKEAYTIKRKLFKNKPAEAMICHLCKKVDNSGDVVIENGKLVWQCSRCTNMDKIRRTTIFYRKEGN